MKNLIKFLTVFIVFGFIAHVSLQTYISSYAYAALPELDNVPEKSITLRDRQGRHVIYRGVNARIKGIFDVSFDDGREPLQDIPEFGEKDLIEMKKLGFNFLRLPISWSGIAPKPNNYSKAYINKITTVLNLCKKYEISVLLDMHQDAYSKDLGEDGAPAWAVHPKGYQRNEGGDLGNLTLKRISLDTQRAFASFWKNKRLKGKYLWDHYTEAMMFLLSHTAHHPAVVGIQIMNEPWLLHINRMFPDDLYTKGVKIDMLWDFYSHSIKKIRKKYKDIWIYIEPDVSKSAAVPFLVDEDQLFKATGLPKNAPWNTYNTVYAPHLYTLGMVLDGFLGTKLDPKDPGIKTSIEYSLVEAEQIKAPFMIGEFGFSDKSKFYGQTMSNILDFADKYMFHTAQWLWKETSQGSWGFWDYDEELGDYILREESARKTARAYPSKISGTMSSFNHNNKYKILEIELENVKEAGYHKVIWPIKYGYSKTPQILCGTDIIKYKMNEYGELSFTCKKKFIRITN
jgi:endoglycosylceramidase